MEIQLNVTETQSRVESFSATSEKYQAQRTYSQSESIIRLREPIYNLRAISDSKNSFSAT